MAENQAVALKGFIKDSAGNIILPFTRGELVFAANGDIAFHSADFVAYPIIKDEQGQITDPGRYGVISPEDLFNLRDALLRLVALESAVGIESGEGDDSLSNKLDKLITKVGDAEVIDDRTGAPIKDATGIYKYVIDKIVAHLADSDAIKFKGTIGTGGEFSALPTQNVTNGSAYKIVGGQFIYKATAGSQDSVANSGDVLIALRGDDGQLKWLLIPSGDEAETFIKIGNATYSGEIEIVGGDGVTVTAATQGGKTKITISGKGTEVEDQGSRIAALEKTVNGNPGHGQQGQPGYEPPTVGLTTRTEVIEEVIKDRIKTAEDLIKTEEKSDGQGGTVPVLVHGDDLVTGSAVYQIATTITTAMLTAETMALNTPLTDKQLAYVAGVILNYSS